MEIARLIALFAGATAAWAGVLLGILGYKGAVKQITKVSNSPITANIGNIHVNAKVPEHPSPEEEDPKWRYETGRFEFVGPAEKGRRIPRPGEVIDIGGVEGGPLLVEGVTLVEENMILIVVDGKGCRIQFTAPASYYSFEYHPERHPIGLRPALLSNRQTHLICSRENWVRDADATSSLQGGSTSTLQNLQGGQSPRHRGQLYSRLASRLPKASAVSSK